MIPSTLPEFSALFALPIVRRVKAEGSNTLLIMPSTRRAIALAARIARSTPCWITTGPVTQSEFSRRGLQDCLRTPAQIERLNRSAAGLQQLVISFPDQIVGSGPSFHPLPLGGAPLMFSLLEVLLVRRHRPTVYSFHRSRAGFHSLTRLVYADVIDDDDALFAELHRAVALEISAPARDWLASECVEMKRPGGVDFAVNEALKDIESLLRTSLEIEETNRAAVIELLRALRLSRGNVHAQI
jgi:hypothetical protein